MYNIKITLFTFATFLLLFSSTNIYGLGIELGPFSFNIKGSSHGDPICSAIKNTHLLELSVVTPNKEDPTKDTISHLLIKPYALGYNKKGEPILLGHSIKNVRLIKGSEEKIEEGTGRAYIGGLHVILKEGETIKAIRVHNIRDIKVLKETDFAVQDRINTEDIPEENKIVDTICAL